MTGDCSKLRDWKGWHKPIRNKLIHSAEPRTGLGREEAAGIFEGWGVSRVVGPSAHGMIA